jgi:hypothetical protein
LLFAGVAATGAETPSALEANPAGWQDLLPEHTEAKGWVRLLAGRNTQLSTESQWSMKDGVLVCAGDRGHEYLQFNGREYGDFVLHAEWRFVPVAGADVKYNSGILFRNSSDAKVWHQAQTGPTGGFLFGFFPVDGEAKRVMMRDSMTENRVKPAGEWNVYEITAKGPKISLWVNGAVVNELTTTVPKGFIAFEAEGYAIEFRNVKVKELQ